MQKNSNPETDKQNNQDCFAQFIRIYFLPISIILAFVLWITWKVYTQSDFSLPKEIVFTKTMLAEYYGIDKKTLNKWVKYFGAEVFPDFKIYKKKRKLSSNEYFNLIEVFGELDDQPILTKKQIVEDAEGSYHSLKKCITKFPHKYPITAEAFHTLQKFPPNIGKAIVKAYD